MIFEWPIGNILNNFKYIFVCTNRNGWYHFKSIANNLIEPVCVWNGRVRCIMGFWHYVITITCSRATFCRRQISLPQIRDVSKHGNLSIHRMNHWVMFHELQCIYFPGHSTDYLQKKEANLSNIDLCTDNPLGSTWVPRTKGQWYSTCCHVMMWSCVWHRDLWPLSTYVSVTEHIAPNFISEETPTNDRKEYIYSTVSSRLRPRFQCDLHQCNVHKMKQFKLRKHKYIYILFWRDWGISMRNVLTK